MNRSNLSVVRIQTTSNNAVVAKFINFYLCQDYI